LFVSQLNEFLESAQFCEMIGRYEHMLKHLFKFYCSQGKVDLSIDARFKADHMDIKEWSKFGF